MLRSGDKGDSCNVGVAARRPEFLPFLKQRLTAEVVAGFFAHLLPQDADPVSLVQR